MSIKKLLKEGVTYNTLRKIFEDCCSFLDFYEVMKTYGIERQVSKVMALHFSGLGLQNQGARAYAKFHEDKPTQVSSEHEENSKALQSDHSGRKPQPKMSSADDRPDDGKLLQSDHSGRTRKPQPKMSAADNLPDAAKSLNQVEGGGEDWESEVATGVPRRDFTLKCTDATPLSLGIEDLSYAHSEKTRGKPQANIVHLPSKRHENRNAEIACKRLLGKASKAEVRDGSARSMSNASKQPSERSGRWKKPFKESKQEGRPKKESIFSKRANKKEVLKEKPLKSTGTSEEHSNVKESKPSVDNVCSNEIKPEIEPRRLPCEESRSSGECLLEKSQYTVITGLDSSTTGVVQKFTSVFIGDIAILVPVENSGDDSNGVEFNESDSLVKDKAERASVTTKCSKVVDNSHLNQSPQGPLESHVQDQAEEASITKWNKVGDNSQPDESSTGNAVVPPVSSSQSEHSASHPSHGLLEIHVLEQAEATVTDHNKVMDTLDALNLESSEGNAMISSWMASSCQSEQPPHGGLDETHVQYHAEEATVTSSLNLEQSTGNAMIPNMVVSSVRAEKTSDSNHADGDATTNMTFYSNVTENTNDFTQGSDEFLEGTNHQDATSVVDVTSMNDQGTTCSMNNDSCHDESAIGGNNGMAAPWEQQMPCASLPSSDYPLDQVAFRSFVVNQGFSSHLDNVNQVHRDLQAELSSESSSTSGEQPMDVFSRQPPLGAERGYTPDVQQQPLQLPWVGNANDGIPQMSSGPGFSYNQTSFPSLGNPYGTFHQAQQALPLLKPCYPSFAYPNHVRPMIQPHMVQPPQQVFMAPPFQYRNQMMFSNIAPPSVGFPAQFQTQMYPFLQAATSYSYPSVPFCGNPYEQAQQTTGATVDVNSAVLMHPTDALSQGGPAVDDYPSPTMDSNASRESEDVREDSSSELSSSDSSFEVMIASSTNQMYDNSCLAQESLPILTENNSGLSTSATYQDDQNETKGALKEKDISSDKLSESGNDYQVFSLSHLCYKEVSSDDTHLNKLKDGFFSYQLSEAQEDPVHKQITILSREESAMSMGRRLSPDGSSMDGVCYDSPSDASSVQNVERTFEGKITSTSNWQDTSEENCSYRPSDVKQKGTERRRERSLSPKPQHIQGSQTGSRRNKGTQASSDLKPVSGLSSQSVVPDACPDVITQSVSSKNTNNPYKQQDLSLNRVSNTAQKSQPDRSHRRVRFSKEDVERDSLGSSKTRDNPRRANSSSLTWQEKEKVDIASVEEMSSLTCSQDQHTGNLEGSSQRRSVNRSFTKTTKVDGHWVHEGSRYKDRPQKHVEKRVNTDIRPAHIRAGNYRNRGPYSGMKRPYKDKQSVKEHSEVKKTETDTARTDKNNNSK